MKILSDDLQSTISIERNDPQDPYSGYTLNAKINANKNVFSGQNDSIHFSKLNSFVKSFETFINERKGEVALEMTEGCKFVFSKLNAKGDIGLKFRICKYQYLVDPQKSTELVIAGEMKLQSEYYNKILEDFKAFIN